MKAVLYSFLGLIVMLVLGFSLNYFGLVNFRIFAPEYENARREVYENAQSFVEAKRQAITKYYNEFRHSDANEKSAIRSIVLQEFANFDVEKFTAQQREWYDVITE